MTQPILVTGGSGTLGRSVVARLLAAGHQVRVLSRQPRPAGEVVERLASLAAGPPAGRVPDLGGPQIRAATSLLGAYLHAAGRRRPVLPVRLPGATFAGYRQGGHLAPGRAVGRRSWEQFLAERIGRRRPAGADGTTADGIA
jgi:uncharacterized protein YbjT (DUF2867 family)